jgi:hypothetical protein
VGAAGQPHHPHQVGQLGHLPTRGRVAGVQGPAGGEQQDQAPGPGQVQRLEDEVVVDGVPGGVVAAVVEHTRPKGTLPTTRS